MNLFAMTIRWNLGWSVAGNATAGGWGVGGLLVIADIRGELNLHSHLIHKNTDTDRSKAAEEEEDELLLSLLMPLLKVLRLALTAETNRTWPKQRTN